MNDPIAPFSPQWPSGTAVLVTEDDGSKTTTVTRSKPWQLGHGTWVVLVKGKVGGYRLSRMTRVN